ncbi:hypothetical protein [Clostridium sp.]|uniref:hypothetical protein n=1 Tax=Clostridium sp. TaxID=1506 RepID=UPI003D6CB494
MENIFAPILKEALEIKGNTDLKNIIAQSLQMGKFLLIQIMLVPIFMVHYISVLMVGI